MAPFYVGNVFDDVDDIFWFNHALIKNIIDGHSPIKYKKYVKQPAPFMHSKLRKACLQCLCYETNISKVADQIIYGNVTVKCVIM